MQALMQAKGPTAPPGEGLSPTFSTYQPEAPSAEGASPPPLLALESRPPLPAPIRNANRFCGVFLELVSFSLLWNVPPACLARA